MTLQLLTCLSEGESWRQHCEALAWSKVFPSLPLLAPPPLARQLARSPQRCQARPRWRGWQRLWGCGLEVHRSWDFQIFQLDQEASQCPARPSAHWCRWWTSPACAQRSKPSLQLPEWRQGFQWYRKILTSQPSAAVEGWTTAVLISSSPHNLVTSTSTLAFDPICENHSVKPQRQLWTQIQNGSELKSDSLWNWRRCCSNCQSCDPGKIVFFLITFFAFDIWAVDCQWCVFFKYVFFYITFCLLLPGQWCCRTWHLYIQSTWQRCPASSQGHLSPP